MIEIDPASSADRDMVLKKNQALKERLSGIQKRRQRLQTVSENDLQPQVVQAQQQLEALQLQRQESLDEYHSMLQQRASISNYLEYALKWNVTNDCFHIWYNGPFATINGLRLGWEAAPLPALEDDSPAPRLHGGPLIVPPSPNGVAAAMKTTERRPFLLFGGGGGGGNNSHGDNNGNNPSTSQNSTSSSGEPATNLRVPWMELNSALGQVVLLLDTLQKKPNSGIVYTSHVLQPMGSTSKIGYKKGAAVSWYQLCSDDSFSLFGKRNFNVALQGLLQCVKEAFQSIQKRDRTIAIPHAIQLHGAEWTIGGLSFTFGNDGIEWTRACKYLLTDIKWLVAYVAKHVDR